MFNMFGGKKIKVGVIFGGRSGEHEVSLSSARSAISNLDSKKYEVVPIAITKKGSWLIGEKAQQYLELQSGDAKEGGISEKQSQSLVVTGDTDASLQQLTEGHKGVDIILPLVHGSYGEDGKLQGLLETFGVPYVFSGVLASALAIDKSKTKIIGAEAGLKVLPEVILKKGDTYDISAIIEKVSLPVVVKPAELGSSVGIAMAADEQELKKAIDQAFGHGDKVMIEQFKKGRELTVAVLGNTPSRALPVIEIIPKSSTFYNYEAKYAQGGSDHVCPADIPEDIKQKVQSQSVSLFEALECRDLARVDFIYNEDDADVYLLEINTIPGMTATSLAPEAAKEDGLEFGVFLDTLITEALKRYQ